MSLPRRPAVLLLALAAPAALPALAADKPVPAGWHGELLVSAAVSLKPAVEEALARLERRHPDFQPTLNSGSSGSLLAQIEHGAPVDLFLSASVEEIERLASAGRIEVSSRIDLASNRLVVAIGAGEPPLAGPGDLVRTRFARLAIGNPGTVPAGRYAERGLRRLGLWEKLAPRLIVAENVRQVLEYVARGEADAGLVYRTDLRLLPGRVREGAELPESACGPIRTQGAVITGAANAGTARRLLEFLRGEEGQALLAARGFLPPVSR